MKNFDVVATTETFINFFNIELLPEYDMDAFNLLSIDCIEHRGGGVYLFKLLTAYQ